MRTYTLHLYHRHTHTHTYTQSYHIPYHPLLGPTAPRDIAGYLVQALPENPLLGPVSVAPNGYINFFLSPALLRDTAVSILTKGVTPPPLPPRRVLVDFSSPNIAKAMHVGHLRSTIIGDCLARVMEFVGMCAS
ncbi:arginine--tRNA ligase [archaeon]|nr:MAG: arginine--tRNA ligase [archaeon]